MRSLTFVSRPIVALALVALASLAGCHTSASPRTVNAERTLDSSYTPPGETFSYDDARPAPAHRNEAQNEIKPNRQDVPHGVIHAATN